MDADEALLKAWLLGEDEDGWSDAVKEMAEQLLPTLIAAGYVWATDGKWNFTPEGVKRAMELDSGGASETPSEDVDSSE